MTRTEENESVMDQLSKSLAMITDQMTGNVSKESKKTIEESENSEDLTYFLDALESRVWELGVDTKNADPHDPAVAYKKGKIDAYNSVLCALRKDGTEEADE